MLQELSPGDTPLELPACQEVVLPTIDLTGTPSPGRRRRRELQIGQPFAGEGDQGALADTRWSRNDKQATCQSQVGRSGFRS
jgi:hypothetical protein